MHLENLDRYRTGHVEDQAIDDQLLHVKFVSAYGTNGICILLTIFRPYVSQLPHL